MFSSKPTNKGEVGRGIERERERKTETERERESKRERTVAPPHSLRVFLVFF